MTHSELSTYLLATLSTNAKSYANMTLIVFAMLVVRWRGVEVGMDAQRSRAA